MDFIIGLAIGAHIGHIISRGLEWAGQKAGLLTCKECELIERIESLELEVFTTTEALGE